MEWCIRVLCSAFIVLLFSPLPSFDALVVDTECHTPAVLHPSLDLEQAFCQRHTYAIHLLLLGSIFSPLSDAISLLTPHRLSASLSAALLSSATLSSTPCTTLCTTSVNTYVKGGNVEGAILVLERVLEANGEGVVNASEGLLSSSTSVPVSQDLTITAPIPLDSWAFNAVIKAFVDADDLDMVERIVARMETAGVRPDLRTYTLLVDAHANRGNCDAAQAILPLMRAAGVAPNVFTFTSLLKAYCQAQGGARVDEAWRVMGEMDDAGEHASVVAYNHLLHALCKGARFSPRGYSSQASSSSSQASSSSSTSASSTSLPMCVGGIRCADGAGIFGAQRVIRAMAKAGVAPNLFTFNTLLHGYSVTGNMAAAQAVVDGLQSRNEAKNKGIRGGGKGSKSGNGGTGNKGGKGGQGSGQKGGPRHLAPDRVTYTTLARAMAVHGDPRQVAKVLQEMSEAGIRPNASTWETVGRDIASHKVRLLGFDHSVRVLCVCCVWIVLYCTSAAILFSLPLFPSLILCRDCVYYAVRCYLYIML